MPGQDTRPPRITARLTFWSIWRLRGHRSAPSSNSRLKLRIWVATCEYDTYKYSSLVSHVCVCLCRSMPAIIVWYTLFSARLYFYFVVTGKLTNVQCQTPMPSLKLRDTHETQTEQSSTSVTRTHPVNRPFTSPKYSKRTLAARSKFSPIFY